MFHHRAANRHTFPLYGGRINHRVRNAPVADEGEGPGLLMSPAFWVGGLLSLAAWVALAAALGLV